MQINLRPTFYRKKSFSLRLRLVLSKIWSRIRSYLEHDHVRMLNQLPRYQANNFIIGDYTYGHPDTRSPRIVYFGENATLQIGKFCSIAENVTIYIGGYHRTDYISTFPFHAAFSDVLSYDNLVHDLSTSIGNDVWIGANCIVMGGVKIGNGAVVAAGSVVTKDVEAYDIVGGNPAKLIRKRFSEDQIMKLEKLKWWDWPIDMIKHNIHYLSSNNIDKFLKEF